MRNRLVVIPILAVAMLAVLSLLVAPAGAQAPKPITKQGLIDALRIGGLSLQELIQFVRDRGVDFQVTPEVEAELRTAAAQRDLIEAVRGSFKGAAAPGAPAVPPAAPLTKSEIVTLLQVGTPPARIEQLVGERGVSFALTLEIGGELQAAGATPTLLEAIARRAPAAAPAPVAAPAAAAPAPAAAPVAAPAAPKSTPNITSLREMKKLYIEKMPNDLDQFLRAEIVKELKDRIVMVLSKEDADAIMTGSGENRTGTGAQITGRYLGLHDNATGAITISDRTGTVVLWSSEAGDRSLFWSSLRRGGPRKVADRLVNNLKKALQ